MLRKTLILFAFFAAITAEKQQTTIQLGWTKFLLVDKVKLPWLEAVKYCSDINMTLFSPYSAERNEKLTLFFIQNDYIDKPTIGNEHIYWTSGQFDKKLGKFVWNSIGEEFTYTNWLPGNPDNWRGDEFCVEMGFKEVGKWNDTRCKYRRYFICEQLVEVPEILF